MGQHRYPGVRPFSAEDHHLFFGREEQIGYLQDILAISDSVLLHGKTGVGKSSLIQAGLVPPLTEDGYTPINIRFHPWFPGKKEAPVDTVRKALISGYEEIVFLDSIAPEEKSIWQAVKKRQINDDNPPLILLFDQFEELFTYPALQIKEFEVGLAELLKITVPNRVKRKIDLMATQGKSLIDSLTKQLYQKAKVKMLFAIRSDQVHLVDQITQNLPELLSNIYRLLALEPDEAQSAIVLPAQINNPNFLSPSFQFSKIALEKIITFLLGQEGELEATKLQILGKAFEQQIIKSRIPRIDENDVEDLDGIIANYYGHKTWNAKESIVEPIVDKPLAEKKPHKSNRLKIPTNLFKLEVPPHKHPG